MNKLKITAEPGTNIIVLARSFDAPREQVFRALTSPELVPRWWGPRAHTTDVHVMDVRQGGAWRFVSKDGDGNEFAFRGTYREVARPERYAFTFEWEGMPGYVSLETTTLEEHGGTTTLTNTVRFHSVEDRDGMLASGMESGASDTMDRLEELLATRA